MTDRHVPTRATSIEVAVARENGNSGTSSNPWVAKIEHALQLMGEADSSQHRLHLQALLKDCLSAHPDEPDLQMWLGLVVEVNGDVAGARELYRLAKDGYEVRARTSDDDEANLNRAIALYRLSDARALADCVATYHNSASSNHYVWFTWAYFLALLGRFDDALTCLDARDAPPGLEHDVQALRGLVLEGLKRYDEAIDVLRELLNAKLPPAIEAEVCHVLSHSLIERRKEGDVPEGDARMRRAASLNPDYSLCLAIIHSETGRYRQALTIFDNALAEPTSAARPSFHADLRFYRGQAYWGLEEYDLARLEFASFERACLERQVVDNVILARLYIAKCDLKAMGIDGMQSADLHRLRLQLEEHEPTPLASTQLRDERAHLISVIDAYLAIRSLFEPAVGDSIGIKDLTDIRARLQAATIEQEPRAALCVVSTPRAERETDPSLQVPIAYVCPQPAGGFALRETPSGTERLVSTIEQAVAGYDVVVLDALSGFSALHGYIIGAMASIKSILLVTKSMDDVPAYVGNAVLHVTDFASAYTLGEIALLYETLKRDLLVIKPWPGVMYYERSPSLNLSLSNPLPTALRKAIHERRCPNEWLIRSATPIDR